jgi:formylmethanofuran dehydrogenase subunit E
MPELEYIVTCTECGRVIIAHEWLDDDELVWCEPCFVGAFEGNYYNGEILSEC